MRPAGEHLGKALAGQQLFEDRGAEYQEVGMLCCVQTSVRPSDLEEQAVFECAP